MSSVDSKQNAAPPITGGNPKPANTAAPAPGHVTTGAIRGSCKVYSSPADRPDMRVPFREIMLEPSASTS